MKRLVPISILFLILGIVLASPLLARGFTNADLNDRYWFRRLGIYNFETSNREAGIVFGYIDFNGAGLWDGQFTSFDSDGGTDTVDATTFNGSYSVNTDGSFTFTFDTSISAGHISSDRNFVILSDGFIDNGDIIQGIVTALKISDSPLSLADINGTWRYRDLELRDFENVNINATTCSLLMVCNNGNWNANYECFDSDGSTNTGTLSGTYVLNGNAFNFYRTGYTEVLISTYLSKDKNIFNFTRGSSSENELFIGIAVKEGAKTYTNADLSETYFLHDVVFEGFETDSREVSITVATVTFDGNGNWTGTAQYFDSDGASGSDNISGTYSVNSDGSFTLLVTSDTPNAIITGNISDDNNIIIMSEIVLSGGEEKIVQSILIGVKKDLGGGTQKAMPWIPLLLLDE